MVPALAPYATLVISLGPVRIDPLCAQVTKGGTRVALSTVEYRLLLLLAAHAGRVVTHAMMREALWGSADAFVDDNTLYVYMRRLREKIEDDPAVPRLIQTVRGEGYRSVA